MNVSSTKMSSTKTASSHPANRYKTSFGLFAALLISAFLTGCATGPNADPRDPLEPFNRTMFQFNDNVDRAILKPVATAYRDVTPSPIRTGVNNFFTNLGDLWSGINTALQGRPENTADNLTRFAVNSTLGLAGILDIATEAGLERHKSDFGQTLGVWGVPSGSYVVLPLFGPSTVRDTAALPVDLYGDPVAIGDLNDVALRNSLYGVRAVDARSQVLRQGNLLNDAALDRYTFTRDAYLQYRRNSINNSQEDSLLERLDVKKSDKGEDK